MAYTIRLAANDPTDVEALRDTVARIFRKDFRLEIRPFHTKRWKGLTIHNVRHLVARPYYGNTPLDRVCKHCTENLVRHTAEHRCPYAHSFFQPSNVYTNRPPEKPARRGALSFSSWVDFNAELSVELTERHVNADVFSKRYMPECDCVRTSKTCTRYWIRHAPNIERHLWDNTCGRDKTDTDYFTKELPPL